MAEDVAAGAPRPPHVCTNCGAVLDPAARFCHECGAQVGPPVVRTDGSGQSAGVLSGTIVWVYAVIGLGLGVATLLFLWATGVLEGPDQAGLESLGQAFFGGIALAVVFVFALLVGVVVAAFAGVYSARMARTPLAAIGVAGIASAVGHVAMVLVLGVILISGLDLLAPQALESEPTPTPVRTQNSEELAACEEAFGQGSPLCRPDQLTEQDEALDADETEITVSDLSKLGLGVVPAALVGALAAALFVSRGK